MYAIRSYYELRELRKQCGIWAYTTDFDEINCIGALEAQDDGVVPCVINKARITSYNVCYTKLLR